MQKPLVSVVIPVYNNAKYLGDAIRSVLEQTYGNFELIIVNDASPDNSTEVIKQFNDARIKYIEHNINKGLSAARNTGIRSSQGEYIALLDGDDYFHIDKFNEHVNFFEKHPNVDVTYNARFELNHSSTTIRELWRPPLTVDLADLILGYPFAPSDMVVRRQAIFDVNLFDESLTYFGEDLDINCKLALTGCKFASVDRALNYRRFHSRREIKNLSLYKDDELRALHKALDDERFPTSLSYLRDKAISNRFLGWAILAFIQEDNLLGQEFSLEAVRLNPSLMEGMPNEFLQSLISFSTLDDNLDHEMLIRKIVEQLPSELKLLTDQVAWALSRGYLIRGCRAVMWGRFDNGRSYLEKFSKLNGRVDTIFLRQLCSILYSYEMEFGFELTQRVIRDLSLSLEAIGAAEHVRWLKGEYSISRAFRNFEAGEFSKVPGAVMRTISYIPSYLLNRGVLKIFFKSLVNLTI